MQAQTPPTSTPSTSSPRESAASYSNDAYSVPSACIAFAAGRRVAVGSPLDVALALNEHFNQEPDSRVLVFDATTSRPVELNVAGTKDQVASRYAIAEQRARDAASRDPNDIKDTGIKDTGAKGTSAKPKRGRPKLGVVGREVTLLPRHWEWLGTQPGSASVTLRKLIEKARKEGAQADRKREAQEAAYRFMLATSGDHPGYEEALRALYAGRREDFRGHIDSWPADIRDHTWALAEPAL